MSVIVFYVPKRHINTNKYVPKAMRGRVLQFIKKSNIVIIGAGYLLGTAVALCMKD